MNAIKFIQQHGVEKARKVIDGAPDWAMSINFNNGMYYSRMEHKKGDTFLYDIKRLVESVDIITKVGGIDYAKYCVSINKLNDHFYLKQAIADYEQLFGNTETLELETLRDCDTSPNCKKV